MSQPERPYRSGLYSDIHTQLGGGVYYNNLIDN